MKLSRVAQDIRLDKLSLGYPGKVLMEDLNAVLPAGKISVILGGSGCGKSTLLRHILGLNTPVSGRIFLGETNLTALEDERAYKKIRTRMGVLFQDGAMLGSLTLGENVALPMQEHTELPDSIIEEVVQMKLRMVGLGDFMHYFPSQLSGGMRKRAGLARAMVMDPTTLLCDEPSSGLDPVTAADLDQLILKLKETFQVTTIVVTHDLDSLFNIADHVVVLHNGRCLYQGDLDGLRESDDEYIIGFLERRPTKLDDTMQRAVKFRSRI
ncbi:ABC transporter ATP-binding protein [Maridesulfovibrio hydrothermalis]|uniref:ABC transporter related n=1 Tax=Maridesulfovibrio hydrothermalis AM13 = DSM 14728 TaxID=1121451 RepID=L0R9Z8_9BACT|nr:ATP-binding cassette domain-containing protein [Maridesulfovibrio hydrothermalis]CCO23005.1 ABC transporter related [Maridesulfovibrio hydrothermalis AM13 = DSM 14728]